MHRTAHRFAKRVKAAGRQIFGNTKPGSMPLQAEKEQEQNEHPTAMSEPLRAQAIQQRYHPVCLLGEGGNGQVHLCHDAKMGHLVAVKTVHHDEPSHLPPEAQILQFLGQHENIVRYYTALIRPGQDFYMQLIFEYCELGDLSDYLEATSATMPEMFIWHAFQEISGGLHFIHSAGVVHGDIKPANILLAPAPVGKPYPVLKVADFGTAKMKPPNDTPLGHLSTIGYQAPEAVTRFGPENDIWALGCIVHQMAARALPELELELELEREPSLRPDIWFVLNKHVVPPGTPEPRQYRHFCHYMAHHPPAPMRIDEAPMGYSKLLNYFMKRTLDANYQTRITACELHRVLPVLEQLACSLLLVGQEAMMNRFDDGWGSGWTQISFVTDSSVFEQIFYTLALGARHHDNAGLLALGMPLMNLMGSVERIAASQYIAQLDGAQRRC
ncbi:hypothetical protein ACEQ8H_006003 [Pleosporales sp. CAS-2024a]